jgi:hypothetical protein
LPRRRGTRNELLLARGRARDTVYLIWQGCIRRRLLSQADPLYGAGLGTSWSRSRLTIPPINPTKSGHQK